MEPYGLSMNRLAMDLHVPVTRIAETTGAASRPTPQFWMNMQPHYELQVAEDELATKVERQVQPLETVAR
ncbi:MAG TPA: hypothetical protein VNE63_16350 [Candidatus Acidoferrales bacterium]|nr:hypothetical protein [Candidatus Acidoferrales bacterium]